MPSTYQRTALTTSGVDLYNAIITNTPSLNGVLPAAVTGTTTEAREIGNLLYNQIDLSNAFINALLNRVAITVLQSKVWDDPWMSLEKGKIEYGEVIQEVFIKMAKPHNFDQEKAESEVFKREIPDVMTAFHAINYRKFYKQTISREELRQAFLSWQALIDFTSAIIQNMFTSAYYDSFQTKKYILAQAILNGALKVHQIPAATAENAGAIVAAARGVSNMMTILSPNYNFYGVPNFSRYDEQVIIINAMYEGVIDVEVLAASFNMDKAEFLSTHRLITDGFGNLDTARLAELFSADPSYQEISADDLAALDAIPFVIVDRSFFQIYDYFNGITNIFNSDGLYWNYDLHVWKAFGASPFANGVVFNSTAPGITSVTVSPSAATASVGQTVKLEANVVTTGFASKEVVWSSNSDNVTVNVNGVVTIGTGATGTATITATSIVDSTKTASATITIA